MDMEPSHCRDSTLCFHFSEIFLDSGFQENKETELLCVACSKLKFYVDVNFNYKLPP